MASDGHDPSFHSLPFPSKQIDKGLGANNVEWAPVIHGALVPIAGALRDIRVSEEAWNKLQ
jgi:hypothetical protein